MVRMNVTKWDRAQRCAPAHNIISSDFPKYNPQPWKFMEGKSRVEWLLSNEYQRLWVVERDQWKHAMYPEITTKNVDFVARYVLTFNSEHKPPKIEVKTPFKMKKFEGIPSRTDNHRPPGDKAMSFEKIKKKTKKKAPKPEDK